MTRTTVLSDQSKISLAAYAKGLFFGISDSAYKLALQDEGSRMPEKQAEIFASTYLNPQFAALATQIDSWLQDPARLQGHTFTVSDHSLGGYLAAAVKERHPSATEAYVFNAPGTGGLVRTIAGLVSDLLGVQTPGADGVWNIKATEGMTFAAGLGRRDSTVVPVQIFFGSTA